MAKQCEDCKFWRAVGSDEDGKWKQLKSRRGRRLGWCLRSRPTRIEKTGRGQWPQVEYDDECGEYEPKVTELQQNREAANYWFSRWGREKRDLLAYKRKTNKLIKAVKAKYPKIRRNDRALEIAGEIIQEHDPQAHKEATE